MVKYGREIVPEVKCDTDTEKAWLENLGEHFHLSKSASIIEGTQSAQGCAFLNMTARESSVLSEGRSAWSEV